MIAAWMLYSVFIAVLLSAAALLLERAAGAVGWSRRWIWAGAVAASLGLPAAAALGLGMAGGDPSYLTAAAERAMRVTLEPLVVGARPARDGLSGLDVFLLAGWLAVSAALLAVLGRSLATLGRLRAEWIPIPSGVLGFGEVGSDTGNSTFSAPRIRLAEEFGPAVVGFRRGEIVLPRWCLELPPADRALVLAHETEHVRSGDVRLLLAARLAVACLPWLIPAWWQLHRLRLAVEIDCDGRVLRRGADAARYGQLLLEVGRRRTASLTRPVAALAEPASQLERRIRAVIYKNPHRRWLRAALTTSGALAILFVACESPTPTTETPEETEAPERVTTVPDAGSSTEEQGVPTVPSYVPRDQEPRLQNAAALSEALRDASRNREEGADPARVVLYMFVDAEGQVVRTSVAESSGDEALDATAEEVIRNARFEPARRGDEKIGVWVQQRVEFR